MNKLIIVGAGGHSKVIQDIVYASGECEVHAILDDSIPKTVIVKDILYSNTNYLKELDLEDYLFIIAIGDNQTREKIVKKLSIPNHLYTTIIHPTAIVSRFSEVKSGTVIMPYAVINANTTVGSHSIINTHAVVEHDNVLEDFVHISPSAILAGGVRVKKQSHLGAGSVVIPNKNVGARCIIGAGAVVTEDIPNDVTAVGMPAKIIKERSYATQK